MTLGCGAFMEGMPEMKYLIILLALAGCSTTTDSIKPFPASLTYGGRSPIVNAPVGSSFSYDVRDEFGDRYQELYEVKADHTVRLVTRFKYSRLF